MVVVFISGTFFIQHFLNYYLYGTLPSKEKSTKICYACFYLFVKTKQNLDFVLIFLVQGSDILVALLEHPVLVSASHSFKGMEETKVSVSSETPSPSKYVYVFQREYATVDPALVDVCTMLRSFLYIYSFFFPFDYNGLNNCVSMLAPMKQQPALDLSFATAEIECKSRKHSIFGLGLHS